MSRFYSNRALELFDLVVSYLTKQHIPFRQSIEKNTVEFNLLDSGLPIHMVFRIKAGRDADVTIASPFPFRATKEAEEALCRTVMTINQELQFGAFTYDFQYRELQYINGIKEDFCEFDERAVDTLFRQAADTVGHYYHTLYAVAKGQMDYPQFLKEHRPYFRRSQNPDAPFQPHEEIALELFLHLCDTDEEFDEAKRAKALIHRSGTENDNSCIEKEICINEDLKTMSIRAALNLTADREYADFFYLAANAYNAKHAPLVLIYDSETQRLTFRYHILYGEKTRRYAEPAVAKLTLFTHRAYAQCKVLLKEITGREVGINTIIERYYKD